MKREIFKILKSWFLILMRFPHFLRAEENEMMSRMKNEEGEEDESQCSRLENKMENYN